MDISGALITAAGAILAATVGYLFSKSKEREADWRKKKLEMYHELFDSISGIVKEDSTPESQKRFARACNTIGLIASAEVIRALQGFQVASRDGINHDEALTKLLLAIRADMGLPLDNTGLSYQLWSSGTEHSL